MKVHLQRLLALFMVLALSLGLFVTPAFAAEEYPVTSTGSFFQAIAERSPEIVGYILGNPVASLLTGVCPSSDDNRHHGKVVDRPPDWLYPSTAWRALCDYCGKSFVVYDDDMQRAYDEHVGDMQNQYGTTNINIYGYPVYYVGPYSKQYDSARFYILSNGIQGFSAGPAADMAGYGSMFVISREFSFPFSGDYLFHFDYSFSDIHAGPSTCSFEVRLRSSSLDTNYYSVFGVGNTPSATGSRDFDFSVSTSSKVKPNTGLRFWFYAQANKEGQGSFSFSNVYIVPKILPDMSEYNFDTRVGTFSGNFGYYGDNGQMITAENVKIVDETNNTYYNPATGQTAPVKDWTYDYSDRSYHLTLDGGTTTTVTYGGENVTIKEGDTTYNVYYIVQDSGGGEVDPTPSPSPTPCPHDYTGTVTEEPTCIAPGVKTYICSLCGNTYPEKIPATGHKWEVKETIHTQYDEQGNVTQVGYTIWKCSVCGEEYKDTEGTGPPNSGGSSSGDDGGNWFTKLLGKLGELLGSVAGGLLEIIGNALLGILDSLITLVTTAVTKLVSLVDLFGTFGEALRGLWSWLPEEVVTVLVAGVTVVIFGCVLMFLKNLL